MAVGHGSDQLTTGTTGTINQHPGQRGKLQAVLVGPSKPVSGQGSRQTHRNQQQHRLDDADRPWYARHADGGESCEIHQAIDEHGLGDSHQGRPSRVPEDGPVETLRNEDGQCNSNRKAGRPHRFPDRVARQRYPFPQTKVVGEPYGQHAQADIHGHDQAALGVARQTNGLPDQCRSHREAASITFWITATVFSISACVKVGCTKNIKEVSPNAFATGNLSRGRQGVPSNAFSR